MPAADVDDVVEAVNEIVTNSVRHDGGRGTLRMWRDGGSLDYEVVDGGQIADRLVGRRRPGADDPGGRSVRIANHVCDSVQVRSGTAGTTVRLHVTLP